MSPVYTLPLQRGGTRLVLPHLHSPFGNATTDKGEELIRPARCKAGTARIIVTSPEIKGDR